MVVVEGFGDKINMWVGLVFIAAGIFQLWLGYQGIEYHLGAVGAIAAVIAAFGFRIILPLTIGSYFGAVDVMGWDRYIGLVIAAPGLLFAAPYLVTAALEPFFASGKTKNISVSSGGHYPNQQSVSSALGTSNHAPKPTQNKSIIEAKVIENTSISGPISQASNISPFRRCKYCNQALHSISEKSRCPNCEQPIQSPLKSNPNKVLEENEAINISVWKVTCPQCLAEFTVPKSNQTDFCSDCKCAICNFKWNKASASIPLVLTESFPIKCSSWTIDTKSNTLILFDKIKKVTVD